MKKMSNKQIYYSVMTVCNNYYYQFIMQNAWHTPFRRIRQVSFSEPFESYSEVQRSRKQSPSIAIQHIGLANSRERNLNASPLHNLHYKYLPNNYNSPSRRHSINHQTQPAQKETNHKVENMKLINNKIKNILNSINDEEKRKNRQSVHCDISRYNQDKSFSNAGLEQWPSFSCLQKNYSDNRANEDVRYQTPLKSKNTNLKQEVKLSSKYSNMSSIKTENSPHINESKSHKFSSSKQNGRSSLQILHNENRSQSRYKDINSIYSNFSGSRLKNSRNEECVIKGKNINTQIDRIQMKIQELQKIKQKLKINFNDQLNQQSIRNQDIDADIIMKEKDKRRQDSLSTKGYIEIKEITSSNSSMSQSLLNNNLSIQNIHIDEKLSSSNCFDSVKGNTATINCQDVHIPKILSNLHSKRKRPSKVERTQSRESSSFQQSVGQFVNINGEIPITIETFRVQQIKPTPPFIATETKDTVKQNQLKRLLLQIEKQIKIDDNFRKAKKWFQKCKKQSKWRQLQADLKKKQLWISQQLMKLIFTNSSEQQNPFYIPNEEDYIIANLSEAFSQCQQNWNSFIQNQYNEQQLIKCRFMEQSIDISKRGYINIEDLVRFINYQLDTFYRNRDIYLIYHRFKKSSRLYYADLLKNLVKEAII